MNPSSSSSSSDHHLSQKKLIESKFISALNACKTQTHIKLVHARIIRSGLHRSSYLLSKLIRLLTSPTIQSPSATYPLLVFQQVPDPNPFLYTALIRGYSVQKQIPESVSLYSRMRRNGVSPVSFTFTALLKACGGESEIDLGRQMHAQMDLLGGFDSDLYVRNSLIDMYVKCSSLVCGRKVFEEMPVRDAISWTTLIVAYTRGGDMGSARELFDELPVKDMVAWTAMVTGFVQNAKPREALDFFRKMQGEGVETDEVTLVGVISACAQLGASKYANWVRDVARISGFEPEDSVLVGSAMIDMYSKCGSVEEAYKVFEKMRDRNVFSYSSMIVGFAMHGRANEAIELFERMEETEIRPNGVTLVGVLTACSHVGMVEYGRKLFDRMEKCYGVVATADHYACMIDLFGRAGKLKEALEFIGTMTMDPHGGVWGALLGACRIHRNPDIAEIAASHLFELEPKSIGNYLLLSNIYASAGRWDDVTRVRKLMRTKGLKKNPGCSWTEGEKGEIHEFFAGDMTHPRIREIKYALEDLVKRLIIFGYQPNLSCVPYDLGDEDKKRILMGHSEKLALSFGLLRTSGDNPITIVKNLRICEDCHSFMCGISHITKRKIVVRDNMRFHHFSNGVCTCGNFW